MDLRLYTVILGASLIGCDSKPDTAENLSEMPNVLGKSRLVNGLTLEQRATKPYELLIANHDTKIMPDGRDLRTIKEYFPDLEKLSIVEGQGEEVPEGHIPVIPISFYYTNEANLTLAVCVNGMLLLVYPNKLDHLPTFEEIQQRGVLVHPWYKNRILNKRLY